MRARHSMSVVRQTCQQVERLIHGAHRQERTMNWTESRHNADRLRASADRLRRAADELDGGMPPEFSSDLIVNSYRTAYGHRVRLTHRASALAVEFESRSVHVAQEMATVELAHRVALWERERHA